MEKITYKQNKFMMKIIDNTSHSQLTRSGLITDQMGSMKPPSTSGSKAVVTYTWYSTPEVIRELWRMALAQHKFSKRKSTLVRLIP